MINISFVAQIITANKETMTRQMFVKFKFEDIESTLSIKVLGQGYDSVSGASYVLKLSQSPRQMILDVYSKTHKRFTTNRGYPSNPRYLADGKDNILTDTFMQELQYGENKIYLNYFPDLQIMIVNLDLVILTPTGPVTDRYNLSLILVSDQPLPSESARPIIDLPVGPDVQEYHDRQGSE